MNPFRLALMLTVLVLIMPLAQASPVMYELRAADEVMPRSMTSLHLPTIGPFSDPWLVPGVDNRVNVSFSNMQKTWWNGTFTLNVTGATVDRTSIEMRVPPQTQASESFVVHPPETGRVIIRATSDIDTAEGEPATTEMQVYALPPVSVRFLDPPPPVEDEDGFKIQGMREGAHFVRIRPGETIVPRIEVRNPTEATLPAFVLELHGSQHGVISKIDVAPLEARATRIIEMPDYTPMPHVPNMGRHYGAMGHFDLRPHLVFSMGSTTASGGGAAFDVRHGAVVDLVPAHAFIEVRSGVVIDLLTPQTATLGVPTRVKFNVTNLDDTPVVGQVEVRLETPNGLHYGVQGPESRLVQVRLGPGASSSGSIDFTPRVTGQWSTSSSFASGDGMRMGHGGTGFHVDGPVSITVRADHITYARLSEPVEVDVRITTTETLAGATLHVATRASGHYYGGSESAGTSRPGLAHRLVTATTATADLGTLRPGGTLDVPLSVVSSASGRYTIVPYVQADGFAYTSTMASDEPQREQFSYSMSSPPMPPGQGGSGGMSSFELAVQPRALPTALALAPLTVGIVTFVGAWTMRTRFVR